MSLRFAASRHGEHAFVAQMLTAPALVRAANDNGRPIGEMLNEPTMLRSALLHFARHGLAAAEHARNAAEAAFATGDEEQYRHWLTVCRILDRRMAQGTKLRLESEAAIDGQERRTSDLSLALC
jgi:glycerol-3-phosphate O-acyltransferase